MQQPLQLRQKISLVKKIPPKPRIYFLLFPHSLTHPRQLSSPLLPISTLAATVSSPSSKAASRPASSPSSKAASPSLYSPHAPVSPHPARHRPNLNLSTGRLRVGAAVDPARHRTWTASPLTSNADEHLVFIHKFA